MLAPVGRAGRWALMLLCYTLLGGVLSCQQESICQQSCCDAEPDCSSALHLICWCPDIPLMSLREGEIPRTVQIISIFGPTQVIFYANALRDLTSLATLDLQDIESLELRPGGLTLQKTAQLRTLRIENIDTANISALALSGAWDCGTQIKMHRIRKLHIHRNGFAYQSSFAPSLSIANISLLEMASDGLTAPIRELSLSFASIKSCTNGSFSEYITHISMKHVNITEIHKWCIRGSVNSTTLSVKSCNIGTIHSFGITGAFTNVALSETNITTIQEYGAVLRIATMNIADLRITELMSHGINITATDFIHINRLRVEVIRRHGLIDLQISNRTVGYLQPVHVYQLDVMHADEGSLAFAEGIDANILRLSVRSPQPPVCPTEKWARWLVGKGDSDGLSPVENQILRQLHRHWLCGDDETAPKEIGGSSLEASGQDVAGSGPSQPTDQRDGSQEEADVVPGDVASSTAPAPHEVTLVDGTSEANNHDFSEEYNSVKTSVPAPLGTGPSADPPMESAGKLDPAEGDIAATEGTASPADSTPIAQFEPAEDGGGAGSTRRETFSMPGPSEEELGPLQLQLLQLSRRLVEMENTIEEIREQNESRTLREVFVFTACALYFVFKTCWWMDRKNSDDGRSLGQKSDQSQPLM